MIKIGKEYCQCQIDHKSEKWYINFININKDVELAYSTDVIWNTEELYEVFEDIDINKKISHALKAIYEMANMKKVK